VRKERAKPKLGTVADDNPVKPTVDLPANVYRDLVAYADLLARETGSQPRIQQNWLRRCLARFKATDRAFAKVLRKSQPAEGKG
jgi:hypothetical protein